MNGIIHIQIPTIVYERAIILWSNTSANTQFKCVASMWYTTGSTQIYSTSVLSRSLTLSGKLWTIHPIKTTPETPSMTEHTQSVAWRCIIRNMKRRSESFNTTRWSASTMQASVSKHFSGNSVVSSQRFIADHCRLGTKSPLAGLQSNKSVSDRLEYLKPLLSCFFSANADQRDDFMFSDPSDESASL